MVGERNEKKKVLFICTHNSVRSQMAEGFLNTLYPNRYKAYSAGTEPSTVNPLAVQVMEDRDIKNREVIKRCLYRVKSVG
ncbi:MAG: hypothetical protein DRG87_11705 [Deltaproteobacteria bacterium]|nr:MAG: hypothetical protein DRG87_11705 [Deltaproteobacteria bacterium]